MFSHSTLATSTRAMWRPATARTMATRVPIVGGNWKCNAGSGVTVADVETLVNGLNDAADPKCETYIAPPSLYLMKVKEMAKSSLNVCAQVRVDGQGLRTVYKRKTVVASVEYVPCILDGFYVEPAEPLQGDQGCFHR